MKIVLIGAGSAMFTQGLVADFIVARDFGALELALVDINEATLQAIAAIANKMVTDRGAGNIRITSTTDRREALPGADVVVTTIAVGGRRAWENDVFIPRKYGIFQPVGDTTMPGGISRALRMIPVMLDIARDVRELCPAAWFFNYSNPMTAICAAIRKETSIPVIGLCHGVNHVEQYLAKFLEVDAGKLKSHGAGLNHLTFLTKLYLEGDDAWPLVDAKLRGQAADTANSRSASFKTFAEAGGETKAEAHRNDNPFSWSLYERYRAFPAVLDRHVTEFFPERFPQGSYYGHVLGKDAFSFEATIAYGDRSYEEMYGQADGTLPLNDSLFARTEGEHEQLADMIRSLRGNGRETYYVNVPNRGAVPNLPAEAILELPAVVAANGFMPIMQEELALPLAAILRRRISVVELTVEAAVRGDRRMFEEALLADGAVPNEAVAERLASELLEAHRPYLPQFA